MTSLRGGALASAWAVAAVVACGGSTAAAIGDVADSGSRDSAAESGRSAPADAGSRNDTDGASVPCGDETCPVSGGSLGSENASFCCLQGPASRASCESGAVTACQGHVLMCDEAADCADGMLCCAEVMRDGPRPHLAATCRPTCITGAPRVQVCTTDQECENGGSCRVHDCVSGLPALRFCDTPAEVCQP